LVTTKKLIPKQTKKNMQNSGLMVSLPFFFFPFFILALSPIFFFFEYHVLFHLATNSKYYPTLGAV
jgi:hypothetical protein